MKIGTSWVFFTTFSFVAFTNEKFRIFQMFRKFRMCRMFRMFKMFRMFQMFRMFRISQMFRMFQMFRVLWSGSELIACKHCMNVPSVCTKAGKQPVESPRLLLSIPWAVYLDVLCYKDVWWCLGTGKCYILKKGHILFAFCKHIVCMVLANISCKCYPNTWQCLPLQ